MIHKSMLLESDLFSWKIHTPLPSIRVGDGCSSPFSQCRVEKMQKWQEMFSSYVTFLKFSFPCFCVLLGWCDVRLASQSHHCCCLTNCPSLFERERSVTQLGYIYSRRSNLGVPIFLKDKRAVRRNLSAFFSYALHLGALLLYIRCVLFSLKWPHACNAVHDCCWTAYLIYLSISSKLALSCIPRYCTFMMQRYAWDMAIYWYVI